jgi:hypothetical protein
MLTFNKILSGFATETNTGFGNQLFMLASTIGIAEKNGYEVGVRENFNCFDYQFPVCHSLLPEFRVPWGYSDIKCHDNVAFSGYMQSERYFLHCESLIKYYFTLKKLSDIVLPDDAIIVHVRRGDYEGEGHHAVLGLEYYDKALKEFSGPVYVFSDEPDKAKELFNGYGFNVIEGNGHYTDFFLMCQGKKHIIANSSFSWWPAWLHGTEVIAPSRWFAGRCSHLDTKDIYAKDWRII